MRPLHYAVIGGDVERQRARVQLLLERGAKIEAKDEVSKTALHCAAQLDNLLTAELLLEKGLK